MRSVTPGAGVEVMICGEGEEALQTKESSLNILFHEVLLLPLWGRCILYLCIAAVVPRQSRSGPGGGKLAAARTRRAGPSFNVGQRRPAIAGIRGTMEYRASDPN